MKEIGIRGVGMYVPEKRLTNKDLETMMDTNDEWIVSRTGISERRLAGDMTTSAMALEAAREAVEESGFAGDDYAFVIGSTATAEHACPTLGARVAQGLGFGNAYCFDLNAACSGLVYALAMGESLLKSGGGKAGLIAAGEKMSALMDYSDRTTSVLFGDGGAAFTLSSEPPYHRILETVLGADPSGADLVRMGGSEKHGTAEDRHFQQEGRAVFRFAVTKLKELVPLMMDKLNLTPDDRFFIIPHQANLRMIENVAAEMKIPMEKFVMNIQNYGNTSSASIGLALAEAVREERFQPGDKLLLIGFGGGLTWGAMAVEW